MIPAPVPECLDCGACCHSVNPRLIELLGADRHTIPAAYVEEADDGANMRMLPDSVNGCHVCSALGPGNACKIYEQRPFLCREFERGSAECLQAIADLKRRPEERRH
jgi:uncharacterized protein